MKSDEQIEAENRLEDLKDKILKAEGEVYEAEFELNKVKNNYEYLILKFKSASVEYKNKYGEGYIDKMYRGGEEQ